MERQSIKQIGDVRELSTKPIDRLARDDVEAPRLGVSIIR